MVSCLRPVLFMTSLLIPSLVSGGVLVKSHRIQLTPAQAKEIGMLVWRNECAGTVEGLTSWNDTEEFPSLGIGHFIWYPAGRRGPFQESFPAVVEYLSSRHAKLPSWLSSHPVPPCPWATRTEFLKDLKGPRLVELRQVLSKTVDLQVEFLVKRQEEALPRMLSKANPDRRPNIESQFYRVASHPRGPYALIDYVNFKGEGCLETERYAGEGWGLLQVLDHMTGTDPGTAVDEFVASAKERLKRRVAHSPPHRHEEGWLSNWLGRLDTYRH